MAGDGRHTPKHLEQPAAKVIRRRAEKLLEKAGAAVLRLRDPADAEALHDSRVALRRLRGWLQAFREDFPLKDKQRRELRRLAHSTNAARDAEVSLAWLARRKQRRSGEDTERFASDLRTLREQSYRKVRRDIPAAWRRLSRKLARAATEVDPPPGPFRHAFAASLATYARDFEQARAEARRNPTPPQIHALRIAGKKLRYLTETALRSAPMAAGFLREMGRLHDSAGAIQDLQRLQALAEEELLHRVGGRYRHRLLADTSRHPELAPDLAPYVQVGRVAAREQAQRVAHFRKVYLAKKQPACLRELHSLMHWLED